MSSSAFILTNDESEILLAFENHPSIEKLSIVLRKDISNISRALKKIHEKLPVVEKQNNRWQLTELGKKLNQNTRDAIQFQQTLLKQQTYLKIGTNREFASHILGERFSEIQSLLPDTQLRICAFEEGTEKALLDGVIDIGIDCERPFSPDIAYKLLLPEKIVLVCSAEFKKINALEIKQNRIFELPHLLCDRLSPDHLLKKQDYHLNIKASFNDIATTRSACVAGQGWALLPQYSVQHELDKKKLVLVDVDIKGESSYGVWWLRSRKYLEPQIENLKNWLRKVKI